ncbi:tail length tape measure protein [Shigella sonnei]|nr:tail length tape measure protein [Shigella sonnei]
MSVKLRLPKKVFCLRVHAVPSCNNRSWIHEAGPEAILPLRRGADGKLGGVADTGGSGMVMFAPQYNIEINNDGTNGQIGPAALKVVYDLGKKAAADFMQQQARDGGRLSGAYR